MNTLKLLLVLALIVVGLINRHHSKPEPHKSSRPAAAQAAVNPEIVQSAERLSETLRKCKQTAQNNKETQ